jgi:hypothetical protein
MASSKVDLMIRQSFLTFVLGCSVLLLAGCTARDEPKGEVPPGKGVALETPAKKETSPAKADPREVTLHVDGMSDRLKLI